MGIEVGGLFGLLVLIADIWALVSVLGSDASTGKKVVWIVLILVLPLLGWLIWLLAGRRAAKWAGTGAPRVACWAGRRPAAFRAAGRP